MVTSSVKAPAKKGGAGGAYTWGAAVDVQDYVSTGLGAAGSVGVVMAPSPTSSVTIQSPTFSMDQSAFPTLGTSSIGSAAVKSWGPTAVTTTPQVLNASALRTGALDMVDAQHPRNQFAKKPTVRTNVTTVATPANSGLIDWSQVGVPEAVLTSLVKAGGNTGAAHLGPYGQAAPVAPVPLDALQARNVATAKQYVQQQPKVSKMPLAAQKPSRAIAGTVHQPQKR